MSFSARGHGVGSFRRLPVMLQDTEVKPCPTWRLRTNGGRQQGAQKIAGLYQFSVTIKCL